MKTRDKRSYEQECGLAYALDVVGERWTLLIMRELLLRPRRYKELLEALPGIGTNLLADRLNLLIEKELVEPTEPGRRTGGYRITELGRSLHEPILALARFGMIMGARTVPSPDTKSRASWAVLAIEAMSDPDRAPEVDDTYQFEVDDEVFHVAIKDGEVTTVLGPAESPVLIMSTDSDTFFKLGMRRLDPMEAVVSGVVKVSGTPSAVPRCLHLIGLSNWQSGALLAG